MTGMSGWPTQVDFPQWMRDTNRDIAELKRRGRPSASSILGPGLAPWAVLLVDWNDVSTSYNGVFYSELDSTNSPDPLRRWIGTSWVSNEGDGIQEVWDLDAADYPVRYVRTFVAGEDESRTFSAWSDARGPSATLSVTAAAGVTSSSTQAFVRGQSALVNVSATTTGALAPGDTLFTLPDVSSPPPIPGLTVFGTLIRTSDNAAIRVHISASGAVTTQNTLASGAILRGQFVVPL